MPNKVFHAEISATNHDVINDQYLFVFNSGESKGKLELDGNTVLKKGQSCKAKITLDKALEISLNEKFISKIIGNGENSGGEVIEF